MNIPILKSYAFHGTDCWFVSTIERDYDTFEGVCRGSETLVWEYNWDKSERGYLVHQGGGIGEHINICKSLTRTGKFPAEEE